MKFLIVYAHPQQDSYNNALREQAVTALKNHQHEVQVSDLYAMNFKATADWQDFNNPPSQILPTQYSIAQKAAVENKILANDIQIELEKLQWCDVLILQFPLWWFSAPAILKGWFDRVLVKGIAYDANRWFNTAPLVGRKAMLVTTTQAPAASYSSNGLNGDLNILLQPIHHTLHFVGFTPVTPFAAYGVMDDVQAKRQQYIQDYIQRLLTLEQSTTLPIPIV
jgi:NAD(P)H dehydrogenase (quinone)